MCCLREEMPEGAGTGTDVQTCANGKISYKTSYKMSYKNDSDATDKIREDKKREDSPSADALESNSGESNRPTANKSLPCKRDSRTRRLRLPAGSSYLYTDSIAVRSFSFIPLFFVKSQKLPLTKRTCRGSLKNIRLCESGKAQARTSSFSFFLKASRSIS